MESNYYTNIKANKANIWRTKKPPLGSLWIELTERCNNNCIHCYINLPIGSTEAKLKELSTWKIKEILREAASLGCLTVRFTGGEPLLREDFEELYIYTRKLGIKVLIFTNATLITPKLAKVFIRIPPLKKIEVTVYGMKKKSYERVTRVQGSFEAFKKGVDLLLTNQIPFVVKSALLPHNKEELEKFEFWAATIPWMDKPPSYSMFFDLRCRRDSDDKNRMIKHLRVSPTEGLRVLAKDKEVYINNMKNFCTRFMQPGGDYLFCCGAGIRNGLVDAYGLFLPCMLLRHPYASYDLKSGSLKTALTKFFPGLRKRRAKNHDYLSRCANCFLKGLCEQCPGKSWMEHGTMDTPVEYHCEIAHVQARFIGLLEKKERAWEIKNWKDRVKKLSKNRTSIQEKYLCYDD